MAQYMTRQRKELLAFFERNTDERFSAHQIAEAMKEKDISLSAIYRNLAELENEGKLRKSSKPGSREVYYRFVAAKRCQNQLHLSCKQCGRTYHASGSGADALTKVLSQTEEFDLDKGETVLYGLCKQCKKV